MRVFARVPGSVRAVREFVVSVIGDRPAAEDAALLASELATNAVRYGEGQIEVSVQEMDDVIRVEVHDDSRELPVLRFPGERGSAGRGLQIVATLALGWGAETRGAGNAVWFTLPSGTVHRQSA